MGSGKSVVARHSVLDVRSSGRKAYLFDVRSDAILADLPLNSKPNFLTAFAKSVHSHYGLTTAALLERLEGSTVFIDHLYHYPFEQQRSYLRLLRELDDEVGEWRVVVTLRAASPAARRDFLDDSRRIELRTPTLNERYELADRYAANLEDRQADEDDERMCADSETGSRFRLGLHP